LSQVRRGPLDASGKAAPLPEGVADDGRWLTSAVTTGAGLSVAGGAISGCSLIVSVQ
jgi:hypothetical protein